MKLEEVKRLHPDEWVLVEVIKEDCEGQPQEVELITHSKNRAETYASMVRNKKRYTYHFYNGEIPTEGYAVAFNVKVLL